LCLIPGENFLHAQVPKLRIDPSRAYGGTVSEFFDHIEYIPLETTKESLFGDIGDLIITDSSFVIVDADTKSTLFFKLTGEFIRKMRWMPNTFPDIKYNNFNRLLQVHYISYVDERNNGLHYYTLTGALVNDPTLEKSIYPPGSIILEPGYSVKFGSCHFDFPSQIKDSSFYLVDIFKGDSLYKRLLPYNQKQKMSFCYLTKQISNDASKYIVKNGALYMSTPLEHCVYKITKDTVVKVFEVIFPRGISFSKDVLNIQDAVLLDSAKKIPRPAGTIYRLEKVFYHEKKLFLKGNSPFYVFNATSEPTNIYNYVYDTVSHKIVSLERLTPDEATFFLPVFDYNGGLKTKGLTYFNGVFYSYVPSINMFEVNDKTKSKNPLYPPVLQEYFRTQNRKSNPVIVKMKPKE
jgi:hypothetical protein